MTYSILSLFLFSTAISCMINSSTLFIWLMVTGSVDPALRALVLLASRFFLPCLDLEPFLSFFVANTLPTAFASWRFMLTTLDLALGWDFYISFGSMWSVFLPTDELWFATSKSVNFLVAIPIGLLSTLSTAIALAGVETSPLIFYLISFTAVAGFESCSWTAVVLIISLSLVPIIDLPLERAIDLSTSSPSGSYSERLCVRLRSEP